MLPHELRMGGGFERSGRVSEKDVESGASVLRGVRMGGCPRICLGRVPWGPGSQSAHPPPVSVMERGAEGMHTLGQPHSPSVSPRGLALPSLS